MVIRMRLLALCVLALAGPVVAQEEAAATAANLRGRLEAGAEHRFVMTVDTLLHLRTPRGGDDEATGPAQPAEQKQAAHQWVDFIVRVRETGEQGTTLELEYAGLRFSLESPNQAGAFDSTAPEAEGEPAQALRSVVGMRLLVKVDAEGNVTAVSGGEHLVKPARDGAEGAGEEGAGRGDNGEAGGFWPRVAAQFRERAIVASFLEPILTTRHPTGTARVGETWTYRDKLEESPLGTFTIVTEYRLESVEAETAVIALSGSITAGPAPGGGEAPFDLLGSANSGRMVWNTAEGVLDSLEQTQRVDLRTSMQGVKMDLVNSTTVKLTRMRQ